MVEKFPCVCVVLSHIWLAAGNLCVSGEGGGQGGRDGDREGGVGTGAPQAAPAPAPAPGSTRNPSAPGILAWLSWPAGVWLPGCPGGRADVKLLTRFQSRPAAEGLKVISLHNKWLLWGGFSAFVHPDESIFLRYLETLRGRRNGIIFFFRWQS